MSLIGAALISGGASALSTYFQNKEQKKAAARAQAFSAAEAKKNRKFQKQMSSTAHQRQVKDLKAAGLNPILSAGAGASTPTGATGSASMANVSGYQDSVASALDSLRVKKELKLMDNQNDLLDAQAKKAKGDAAVSAVDAILKSKEIPGAKAKEGIGNWLLEKGKAAVDDFNSSSAKQRRRKLMDTWGVPKDHTKKY